MPCRGSIARGSIGAPGQARGMMFCFDIRPGIRTASCQMSGGQVDQLMYSRCPTSSLHSDEHIVIVMAMIARRPLAWSTSVIGARALLKYSACCWPKGALRKAKRGFPSSTPMLLVLKTGKLVEQ